MLECKVSNDHGKLKHAKEKLHGLIEISTAAAAAILIVILDHNHQRVRHHDGHSSFRERNGAEWRINTTVDGIWTWNDTIEIGRAHV